MNDLQVFQNEQFGEVRRVVRDDDQLWWVLSDVCAALNLSEAHRVAARLDDDEKGRTLITTLGGEQEMTVINESGLYNVILRSRKPEAKAFKRWITHEVIPSIRRTGSYGVPNNLADTIIKLAECVNNLSRRIEALESTPQKPQELLRLPVAMQEVFDEKERKRWTHKVFYKLDCIRDGLAYSHKETLSCCYKYVERICNADLNDERLKYMETTGEDKSVLEIIYANINFRRAFEEAIDYFYNNAIS